MFGLFLLSQVSDPTCKQVAGNLKAQIRPESDLLVASYVLPGISARQDAEALSLRYSSGIECKQESKVNALKGGYPVFVDQGQVSTIQSDIKTQCPNAQWEKVNINGHGRTDYVVYDPKTIDKSRLDTLNQHLKNPNDSAIKKELQEILGAAEGIPLYDRVLYNFVSQQPKFDGKTIEAQQFDSFFKSLEKEDRLKPKQADALIAYAKKMFFDPSHEGAESQYSKAPSTDCALQTHYSLPSDDPLAKAFISLVTRFGKAQQYPSKRQMIDRLNQDPQFKEKCMQHLVPQKCNDPNLKRDMLEDRHGVLQKMNKKGAVYISFKRPFSNDSDIKSLKRLSNQLVGQEYSGEKSFSDAVRNEQEAVGLSR